MTDTMGPTKPVPKEELSHEARAHQELELVYGRKTQERQIFMEGLEDYRKRKEKALLKEIKTSMGPTWYQALSVPQHVALDTLETSIYQDLLEGRPTRTQRIIRALGIIPRPNVDDLMHCNYIGRNDPKAMLGELFLLKYQHPFYIKRTKYDHNGKLILSSMFYLGLPKLLEWLSKMFQPDEPEPPPEPKKKPASGPPLPSPYLQKMTAICYEPQQRVRKPPPPLPNLDDLNEPLEETPPVFNPAPPPPPPPPPPPKKRLPISLCDKMAGVNTIEAYSSAAAINTSKRPCILSANHAAKRVRKSKYITMEKKVYGIGNTRDTVKHRRRKPKLPSTGIANAQYTICGVTKVRGKSVYILGSVSILPLDGEIIHGGHALVNGENIIIHRGIRGKSPPPKPDHCDCVKKWTEPVLKFLKETKCYCGHHYDYYNEGTFPADELPFFEKPTRRGPLQMKYDNIYNVDLKNLHVGKEFKKIWDTDSVLHVEADEDWMDPTTKKTQQKKKKRSSKTCLGLQPKPQDYLKCALYRLRHKNLAARLPDIHLAPELVAWMRKRLHGPFTKKQKQKMKYKSNVYWTLYSRFANHGIPHVIVPKIEEFSKITTWKYKQLLNDNFRKFISKYRLKMFRAHADMSNMMWRSMFQAETPDKKFREIYFSYLHGTVQNLTLMDPYNSAAVIYYYTRGGRTRYRCPPAGVENLDKL